jgi:hypothetical protein
VLGENYAGQHDGAAQRLIPSEGFAQDRPGQKGGGLQEGYGGEDAARVEDGREPGQGVPEVLADAAPEVPADEQDGAGGQVSQGKS